MIFDNLEYKSVFSKYIIKYLEEQRDINHNVIYLKYILRDFDLYLYRNYKNEMNGITKELITGWLVKKDTEKYSTRKHRASIIKNFCLFLTNYIDNVWIVNTKLYYKGDKYIPYIFTQNQILEIFKTIEKTNRKLLNQQIFEIIINILYSCGARITEILSLKLIDIDIENSCIIINNSKGRKQRIVPLTKYIVELLERYIDNNCSINNLNDYIFKNSYNNKPISRVTILNYFHELCEKLSIRTKDNKLPRIHDLRHTFIVHSIYKLESERKNINVYLPVLSTLVGHENIESTSYYLRLDNNRLKIINQIEESSNQIKIPSLLEKKENASKKLL